MADEMKNMVAYTRVAENGRTTTGDSKAIARAQKRANLRRIAQQKKERRVADASRAKCMAKKAKKKANAKVDLDAEIEENVVNLNEVVKHVIYFGTERVSFSIYYDTHDF
ncbi:hypothetical protein L195_g000316 [Trifolium pratense]|uniref:Uncharacterized protein n=1 Tax=Trifolium pratense TaxID=57577 RepID=A0A2K3NLJ7_TRIPR|nr:hypothetical protein L195_g000316 [Trifolium pratense]